jgi:hypothetical protein
MVDDLADMQIRIRLLQADVTTLRQAVSDRQALQSSSDGDLSARLDEISNQLVALPAEFAESCPSQSQAAAAECGESAQVQRVIVSDDKLVVGRVERIWLDPPGAFLLAAIDAGAEISTLHATDVVEFERDGNNWVRFELTVDEEATTVERAVKRLVRNANGSDNGREPAVELRVQLGDVRETVEFVLTDLEDEERPLSLGRNFLTDVALVDVGRERVQPSFDAPQNDDP